MVMVASPPGSWWRRRSSGMVAKRVRVSAKRKRCIKAVLIE